MVITLLLIALHFSDYCFKCFYKTTKASKQNENVVVKVYSWVRTRGATREPTLDISSWYVTSSKPFIFPFFALCTFSRHCLTFITFSSLTYLYLAQSPLEQVFQALVKMIFPIFNEMNSTPGYELLFWTCNSIIQDQDPVYWYHLHSPLFTS